MLKDMCCCCFACKFLPFGRCCCFSLFIDLYSAAAAKNVLRLCRFWHCCQYSSSFNCQIEKKSAEHDIFIFKICPNLLFYKILERIFFTAPLVIFQNFRPPGNRGCRKGGEGRCVGGGGDSRVRKVGRHWVSHPMRRRERQLGIDFSFS